MVKLRPLVAFAFLLSLVAMAPASAAELTRPLYEGTGNMGVVIPYRYAGKLGNSGLTVEATPTMLAVTAIAPGSPAALLDLPDPERYRVRLAAIGGQPVETLSRNAFLALFNPTHESVQVTLARKGPNDLIETFVGPFEVPLSSQRIASLQSHWLADQNRFGEAHAYLKNRQTEAQGLSDNAVLAARDVAAGGDYKQALTMLASVPAKSPLYSEAQHLRARWQLATQNETLAQADALANQGHFGTALNMLGRVQGNEAWQKLRDGRLAQWKSALAQREAYQAQKKAESYRKLKAAEEAKQTRGSRRTRR